MTTRHYRPDSDSEDDCYDGYYFGDDPIPKVKREIAVPPDQKLYEAVRSGDLENVQRQVNLLNWNVNAFVNGGYTLLLHVCCDGNLEIMEYLLKDKQADANQQFDSVMPIMVACNSHCKDVYKIDKMVQLLLKYGAIINVSDKYGTTPLIIASKNGYTPVVRRLIKDAALDPTDNNGCTAIFHAIENNRPDIVRLLVEAGADVKIANIKGYTPRQVAQFHGFYDLLDVLPKESEHYVVPSKFISYNTLGDYIPRIFLKTECPEYFQEVNRILHSIHMEKLIEYFAKEHISLAEFLCITDERLEQIGIELPFSRMKIKKALLAYHLHRRYNIYKTTPTSRENFYDILMIAANQLQNLIIINSTLKYINNNMQAKLLGTVSLNEIENMRINLRVYRHLLNEITELIKYLGTFSPSRNPLYIDYDEIVSERKRRKFKKYFKYTTIVVSISIFICCKVKRIF